MSILGIAERKAAAAVLAASFFPSKQKLAAMRESVAASAAPSLPEPAAEAAAEAVTVQA